ncbi:MAG: SWIM zinc finger domain-containing protein [Anaerolineae bacterium]|nr:SWIM zinc finger domain-containing protein [Anaerolineae bacterium]
MTQFNWTNIDVRQFAPDTSVAKEGQKLAVKELWRSIGRDQYSLWGEYKGSESAPYQVKIDLLRLMNGQPATECTCKSRKTPCKHVIALLLIFTDRPEDLTIASPPEFMKTWLDKVAQRSRRELDRKKRAAKPIDLERRAKTISERQAKISAGFEELELWLLNLIRQGLADPQLKQASFWEAKAARMVDAQAPGIATWLRELAHYPTQQADWVQPLLEQLGRMYLLIQSFKRFDQFSEPVQADLRSVIGWYYKKEDVLDGEILRDQWFVIGRREQELDQKLRSQRLWLQGRNGRSALILEFAYGDVPFDTTLNVGSLIDAEICFFPSAYPLRAFIVQQEGEPILGQSLHGQSILENAHRYSAALAKNPWLIEYSFIVEAGIIRPHKGNGWILREPDGHYMPVSSQFTRPWSLMSLGGGHPLRVAGEWDGRTFYPLGALDFDDRYVDFSEIPEN